MGRWCGCPFLLDCSASRCECCACLFYFSRIFSIQGSLLFHWSSVLGLDVAEEVISSSDPLEFYPAAPFSVEGDGVETLSSGGFCVVSYRFFWWYGIVRNCPPLYPSIYVSFRGSYVPFVESVWLEVPTVLCPLCQGVRDEILVLM